MNKNYTGLQWALLGSTLLFYSFAAHSHALNEFELNAALGGAWYSVENAAIQVTSIERDRNEVSSATSSIIYSAGIGRHLFKKHLENRNIWTGLLVQGNYYYGASSVKGTVWAFEDPGLRNYTFKAPFSSSRFMLDFKPELCNYYGVVPYGIFGFGSSWNQMSYTESAIGTGVDPASSVALYKKSTITVAYDLGVGISKNVYKNTDLSVEYLYTALGRLSPGIYSSTQQQIVRAPSFPVVGQGIMARLSVKI